MWRRAFDGGPMPLLVFLAILLVPATARAEVSDKIPDARSLALECAAVLAVTMVMVLARRRVALRLGVLGLLLVFGLAMLSELRYSDIGPAVAAEKGTAYVAMVWLLLVVPAVGAGVTGVLARLRGEPGRSGLSGGVHNRR